MIDFDWLRSRVRSGECRGAAFRAMVLEYVSIDPNESGYDELDEFLNDLMYTGEMPEPTRELEPGMVEYYKTPARMVFEWVGKTEFKPGDIFYDLGSGLGQVALLVHLLTGIRVRGVEIEPAYCDFARESAGSLGLRDVDFVAGDVRDVDISDGTVFFLYTPFTGEILVSVLDRLRAIRHPIQIVSWGPHLSSSAWNFSTGKLATNCFFISYSL